MAGVIRKLPDSVINMISAGQVIQRPFNVIKQLVQNSIDAGATQINITVQQGGLKMIKISDNGFGIMIGDFPLLCTRFATSKIKDFSDMSSLSSFGFRGQALASLSYVSNLTISSKYKQQLVGHSASFKNQSIQGKISDIPMNIGTTITATDLFLKLETRRASLNPIQQKKRIFKLLCHFSLHYPHIRFSFVTQKGDQGVPRSNAFTNTNQSKMQIFQQITKLSYDKFSYIAHHKINNSDVEVEAIITKINSCKGKNLMLNINNRVVENKEVYKVIEKAYSQCYQSIHQQNQSFWVYLSLKIQPKLIDCNVDPTKKSVGLFASQKIYQTIKQLVLNQIKKDSAIKIIKPNQNDKNQSINQIIRQKMGMPLLRDHNERQQKLPDPSKSKTVYAFQKNRTDCKQLPILYYSQTQNLSQNQQSGQYFEYNFGKKQKNLRIKNFFSECTYVGCYGLNCILIHFQNKLFMLNIVEIIPSFLPTYCQNNKLATKRVRKQINVKNQVQNFIIKTNLLPKNEIPNIVKWISQSQSKQILNKKFGIGLAQQKIIYYPCLGDVFVECIDQDNQIGWQIAYLICRVYNGIKTSKLNPNLQDKFMSQFICSQFIESGKTLSPFNQKISNFFKNRVIPVLKTNPLIMGPQIQLNKYMKQMLDLKDIYKIFERC